MRFTSLFFIGIFLTVPLGLQAQSTPYNSPSIFFSDLDSGPKTGGQKNRGAWVTIWGKGFGAARGSSTVTVGGGPSVTDYSKPIGLANFMQGTAPDSGILDKAMFALNQVCRK